MTDQEQNDRNRQVNIDALDTTLHVTFVIISCIGLAWFAGRIDLAAPLNAGKAFSASGVAVGGWAAYFALKDGRPSWKGARPDEVKRRRIFAAVFLFGVWLSVLGALW